MDLTLQEVLIIGNNNDQVKFSELTLDMFRILQTLEREPQEDASYQAYSLQTRAPSMVNSSYCHSFMYKQRNVLFYKLEGTS